jgi:hypothetical protein
MHFLLAYVTDWEEYKLLEGEANIFFEDTYIGKIRPGREVPERHPDVYPWDGTRGCVVQPGEDQRDLTSKKLMGSEKGGDHEHGGFLLRNNKSQDIKMVLLYDQVPVPTLSEIELGCKRIPPKDAGTKRLVRSDGSWSLSQKNNRDLELRYVGQVSQAPEPDI